MPCCPAPPTCCICACLHSRGMEAEAAFLGRSAGKVLRHCRHGCHLNQPLDRAVRSAWPPLAGLQGLQQRLASLQSRRRSEGS